MLQIHVLIGSLSLLLVETKGKMVLQNKTIPWATVPTTDTRPSPNPYLFSPEMRLSVVGFKLKADTQQMLKYYSQLLLKPTFKFILGENLQQCCLEILFLFSDQRILWLTLHCAMEEDRRAGQLHFKVLKVHKRKKNMVSKNWNIIFCLWVFYKYETPN